MHCNEQSGQPCGRAAAKRLVGGLTVVFAAAGAGFAGIPALAEEETDDEALVEEVIVTGIRGSLQQSLNRKRLADHFVDAITAEDIGAFPDQNLAESLQRISGVAIDRKEGEGAFVSVRGLGPQYVQTTIGGRVPASNVDPGQLAGRGQLNRGTRVIGFDSFQSGLVQAVEVHKSPRADHVEGGLGGFVDIQARKPFSLGERHFAVSVDGTVNDLADDTAPGVFVLYSDILSDTVGFMASAQWDNRTIRSDSLHHYSYIPNPGTLTVGGQQLVGYYPRQILGELHITDRDRLNISSSLQLRPSERVDLTFDLLYTDIQTDETDYWRDFRIQQRLATNVTQATLSNDNGTGVFTSLSTSGAGAFIQQATEQVDTTAYTFGANLQFQATDRLGINVDFTISDTDSPSAYRDYLMRNTGTQMTYEKDGPGGIPSLTSSSPLNDVDWWSVVKHSIHSHLVADQVTQFRIDATYEYSEGWLDTTQVGFRSAKQERGDRYRYLNSRAFIGRPITEFGGGTDRFPAESNFLRGLGNRFPSPIVNPNLDVIQRTFVTMPEAILNGRGFATGTEKSLTGYVQGQFNEDLNHHDDSLALYAMVTFGGEFGTTPYSGNVGVRYVQNDTGSVGQISEPVDFDISDPSSPVLVLSPPQFVNVPHDYSAVLPSLNVRFDPREDLVIRTSLAKVLSRPAYQDLNPRFTGGGIGRTIRAGNGELDPTTAVQFDLAAEWYFADYSIASVGFFAKDIDAFIQLDIDSVTFPDVTDPDTNRPVVLTARRPLNSGSSRVTGAELSFQSTFDTLPAPFDGLGVIANYTLVRSGSDFRSEKTRAAYSVPGLSENTINLTVFYEKERWRGRLSYNYRDDFLDQIADGQGHPYFVDAYKQFDVSFGFEVTEQISLSFEGINLTDENVYYYNLLGTGQQEHFSSAVNAGRRYQFGARFRM